MQLAQAPAPMARFSTRALVVDDDPIMRSLVRARLAGIVDQVVEASDGLEAWHLLSSQTFHLALVDLMMPNIDGNALIKCIRGHPPTQHMPIVVVTSNDDRHSIAQALEAGASTFMTKPLNWAVFKPHIAHLLRLSVATESAALSLARQKDLSQAQSTLVAEIGSLAHSHFRRISFAATATGKADANLSRVAAEASAAQSACDRLRGGHAMIRTFDVVNGNTQSLGRILAAAIAQAASDLGGREVRVSSGEHAGVEVICSESAMVFAVAAVLRSLARYASPDAVLEIEPVIDPASLWVRTTVHDAAWPGKPGQVELVDQALVRTLVAAHGASVTVERAGTVSAPSVMLKIPADRVQRPAELRTSAILKSA